MSDDTEEEWMDGEFSERELAKDSPWPLNDVLRVLADAVDHLMIVHGCDCHGYEEISAAKDAARILIKSS